MPVLEAHCHALCCFQCCVASSASEGTLPTAIQEGTLLWDTRCNSKGMSYFTRESASHGLVKRRLVVEPHVIMSRAG